MKENQDIRKAARVAGIPLWKVAAAVGVSEPTLIRWMRFPLSPEREKKIMAAIFSMEKEAI